MKTFLDYIQSFGEFSPASLRIITEGLREEYFKKDEYLLKAGDTCNHIRFIQEGVVRLFYCDKEGNDTTRYLLNEKHFAVNLYSYNDEIASSEYLQAVTDCRCTSISRQTMDFFYREVPEWTSVIKKITEKALLEKIEVKNVMLAQDASNRYNTFAENHPDLLQRVPLGYIASFLGITQSSLSRIRKTVV